MRIPSFLGAARALALSLVLLGAPIIVAAQTDSTKATAPRALRELLADASKRNVLPPSLISFRSNVETEISVLLRREEGTRGEAQPEDERCGKARAGTQKGEHGSTRRPRGTVGGGRRRGSGSRRS